MEDNESKLPSLMSCVKRPLFILHTVWLSLLQLRFYYFLGTLNKYLNTLFDGDNEQGELLAGLSFILYGLTGLEDSSCSLGLTSGHFDTCNAFSCFYHVHDKQND